MPQLKLSRPNVQNGEAEVQRRYVSIANQFEDEVTGGNPQDILTRGLNLKILFECDDLDGYESIPIFRLFARETSMENSSWTRNITRLVWQLVRLQICSETSWRPLMTYSKVEEKS